jgi:hypothetical protein
VGLKDPSALPRLQSDEAVFVSIHINMEVHYTKLLVPPSFAATFAIDEKRLASAKTMDATFEIVKIRYGRTDGRGTGTTVHFM